MQLSLQMEGSYWTTTCITGTQGEARCMKRRRATHSAGRLLAAVNSRAANAHDTKRQYRRKDSIEMSL
eukprot:IDg14356t1